jgi:hypothetical protein
MPKAYFMVRSVVEERLRDKFDDWYSRHHLPMALNEFKAEKVLAILEHGRSRRALCGLSLPRHGAA